MLSYLELKRMFEEFENEIGFLSFKSPTQKDVFIFAYQKFKFSLLLDALKLEYKEVSECTVSEEEDSDVVEESDT